MNDAAAIFDAKPSLQRYLAKSGHAWTVSLDNGDIRCTACHEHLGHVTTKARFPKAPVGSIVLTSDLGGRIARCSQAAPVVVAPQPAVLTTGFRPGMRVRIEALHTARYHGRTGVVKRTGTKNVTITLDTPIEYRGTMLHGAEVRVHPSMLVSA